MIGSKLAHYEILEKIGAGGMGEVYRARDTKLGRDVALKLLPREMSDDPERRKRFQREAMAIAALKHPNIVTIYSVEEAEGHHFLTMELVEGKTVSELLPTDGFPLEQYFNIAVPLAEAINSAHAAGITHRDLKPANVMLDAEGRVKVLDFGLAKLLEPTDSDAGSAKTLVDDSNTQEGRVLGTVAYMSPEQAEGKTVDARSDIFSLGILLYEMATGSRPFSGDSSLSLLSSILKDTPSSVSDLRGHLPVQLGRIVQHCLEKDPRKRFQSALDIANELEALKLEVSSATGSVEAVRAPRKPLLNKKIGIGGAIFGAALVAMFILNPFKAEVSQDQGANAASNTLAIMYFENLAERNDPKRHGEIIAELLITGLSESDYLSVVSSQRLYDLLKQLGKEGAKQIDRTTATDVARRANARWMMQGSILQATPNFVITSQIVEVSTGNVAASQRTTGNPGETIFALVDRLTAETLKDLAVPDQTTGSTTPSVARMSTHSEDAYRHYLEGIEYGRKLFRQEARDSYGKALTIDSTFAMAAYRLGITGDRTSSSTAYLKQALRHADQAPSREQMYIETIRFWLDSDPDGYVRACEEVLEKYPDDKHMIERLQGFYRIIGRPEKSLELCHRLIALDPMDKQAYNQMAYNYDEVGNQDKAIWALNKYIELAPDEPNPWDSRGDIYARNGRLDEAIASYAKAVEIKVDFADYLSVLKLGDMYMYAGEYNKAEVQYRLIFNSPSVENRSRGRTRLINLRFYQGLLDEALEEVDATVRVDEMENVSPEILSSRYKKRSDILTETGDTEAAVAALNESFIPETPTDIFERIDRAGALAYAGAPEKAEAYLASVKANQAELSGFAVALYTLVGARIDMARGDYDGAIAKSEKAVEAISYPWFRLVLGAAYFKAGRWEDVISTMKHLATNYGSNRGSMGITASRVHYYLGVSYQELGRNSDAIAQLEEFLRILANGDPRIKEIDDSRKRLAVLKQGS